MVAAQQAAGQLLATAGKFASGVLLQTENDIDSQHMGPGVTAEKQAAEQSPVAADPEAQNPQLGDAPPPGSQFAYGRPIAIAEAVLQRVRHMAGEPEQQPGTDAPAAAQDFSSELLDELQPPGLQLGTGKDNIISQNALQRVHPMILYTAARAGVQGICSGPPGLETGGNKPLQGSAAAAQARAHSMLADLDREGNAPSVSAATMLERAVGAHLPSQIPEAAQEGPGREAGAGNASRSQSTPALALPRAAGGNAPSAAIAQADGEAAAGSTASEAAPQAEGMVAAPTAGPDPRMPLQAPVLRDRSRLESPFGIQMLPPSCADNATAPQPNSGATSARMTGCSSRTPKGSGVSLDCSQFVGTQAAPEGISFSDTGCQFRTSMSDACRWCKSLVCNCLTCRQLSSLRLLRLQCAMARGHPALPKVIHLLESPMLKVQEPRTGRAYSEMCMCSAASLLLQASPVSE